MITTGIRDTWGTLAERFQVNQLQWHCRGRRFDPVWLHPKPKQTPHPPILLGGESDHTVKRVIEFCDGWFPRARGDWQPKSAVARLHQAATAAGRDPATLPITVFNAPAEAAALAAYREAGIERVLFEAPDADRYQLFSEYGAKSFVKPVALLSRSAEAARRT